MLTVVCVENGNYEGRGQLYVDTLRAMVARNLSVPHKFHCITESRQSGWWAKIDLFSPGRFTGRVLYLDLDLVITGPLDSLAEHKGLLHLADWGWTKNDYGSGVMCWDSGEHSEIWRHFNADVPRMFRGDQDYLTWIGGWPALPKGLNVSYRYHANKGPSAGAVTVSFHGRPKPHEIKSGWVPELWRI